MQLFGWSADLALRAADYTAWRLAHCGIKVPPSSRLPTARSTVASTTRSHAAVDIRDEAPLAEHVLEAHRFVIELYCITSALSGPSDPLLPVVRRAISGPHIARDDRKGARNLQFECLVAALLRLSGIEGVISAEPDVRIVAGESAVGIAAKRVVSLNAAQRRKQIRRAIDQIHAQRIPGFVALSLDLLAEKEWDRGGHAAAVQAVVEAVEDARREIESRDPSGMIGGAYGFATLLGGDISSNPATLTVDVTAHAALRVPDGLKASTISFVGARADQLKASLGELVRRLDLSLPTHQTVVDQS